MAGAFFDDDTDSRPADDPDGTSDEAVLRRAKRRFRRCQDWEGEAHEAALDDMKFLVGDDRNKYQWDEQLVNARRKDGRPCLTINKAHVHWLSVVNNGKAQKVAVEVLPVSNGATYESAQAFESVIRHIEYISNAQTAYDRALEWQVGGGIGYWRIVTDYVDDNAFDQEIFVRQIDDPTRVLMDPGMKEQDGSDARFAFIFDVMANEDFERQYPKADTGELTALGDTGTSWVSAESTVVAEYFEVREVSDWVCGFFGPDGARRVMRFSDMTKEQVAAVRLAEKSGRPIEIRKSPRREVWWYKIAGDRIIRKTRWLGKYIPIVRCVAEEFVLDGKLERKGLVRYLRDPQKMFNWNASAQNEFGALQGKSPWVAATQAIAGFEQYYRTANRVNHAYMPYNAVGDDGQPLPKPERAMPPSVAPAFEAGMQAAAEQLKMASGQYDALMGAPSNETSGVAVDKRTRQGERSTYHFIDGQSKAVRFTGKILIDLIPRVYTGERVLRVMGDDGKESVVRVDLNAPFGVHQQGALSIFNPRVGTFDVVADVGPNYETRRREAFEFFSGIAERNPQFMGIAGDLLFRAADVPMADEIAKRLENTIPPSVRGEGPSPAEQQLQQQVQQLNALLQDATKRLHDKTDRHMIERQRNDILFLNHAAERVDEDKQKEIDAYKAVTERLKALGVVSPRAAVQTSQEALTPPFDPNISNPAAFEQVLPDWLTANAYEQSGVVPTNSPMPDSPASPLQQDASSTNSATLNISQN